MMPRPRWGGGGAGLSGVIFYVAMFVLALVGLPSLIVLGRWWSLPSKSTEFTIRLLREDLGEVVEMDLEEYLVGVVAAEVPADFHLEALKAQAVAARTYALYRLGEGKGLEGQKADLSSDFRSGQAWMSREAQWERWGWYGYFQRKWRIASAIDQTRGEVLTYGGDPIFAAYHSTSSGMTQDAAAYFNDVPYLRSVPSPGEEISPYYKTTKSISWWDIAAQLGLEMPVELSLWVGERSFVSEEPLVYEPGTDTGLPSLGPAAEEEQPSNGLSPLSAAETDTAVPLRDLASSFHISELYPTGHVKTVEVLGHSLSGREIREKLGLRSNWFTAVSDKEGIIFHIRGNGHGVGMSQYGAQKMATVGHNYRDILLHYYTDVELARWY